MRTGAFGTLTLLVLLAGAGLGAGAAYSAVDNSITGEDRTYIAKYLVDAEVPPLGVAPSFADELSYILAVQRAVLTVARENKGLPPDHAREPKDVYQARSGLAADRARVVEKILRAAGFEAIHVSICTAADGRSAWRLFTTDAPSHVVSAVLTSRGWLAVDPDVPWVSIDEKGVPIEIETIRKFAGTGTLRWHPGLAARINPILDKPFTYVVGFYSRTGHLYPPYNFFPDINFRELSYNW